MNSTWAIRLGALLALLLSLSPCAHATIDVFENGGAGDGLGDIWQMKWDADGLAPTADTDGDGRTNAEEAGAGTDPRSPSDIIEVRNLELNGNQLTLKWASIVGKRYKVQSTANLRNANSWSEVTTNYLDGSGAEMTHTVTTAGPGTFYRIAVYDKDTDGDGVTDWEELQLGLDPEISSSSGSSGVSDLQFATSAITTPSSVFVTAPEGRISENSPFPASFIVTRSGGARSIKVTYSVSGGASPGSDYATLSGTVTVPMNATSASIAVSPLPDTKVESPEAVIVTLTPKPAYTIVEPRTAAILIDDVSGTTGDGLRGQYWNEGSTVLNQTTTPSFTGNPQVSRIDPQLSFTWASGQIPDPANTAGFTDGYWSSRWTGEIMPAYSQIYTFSFETNMAGRVWVNGQKVVDNWPPLAVVKDSSSNAQCRGFIELQAGKRYPIVVEHYQDAGSGKAILRWRSVSEFALSGTTVVDAAIPTNRLFSTVAPQILGPFETYAFLATPSFNYQIAASGNPTSYAAANLPPGFSVNATTGVISGSPTMVGSWQVVLTATNAVGSGSAMLTFNVLQAEGGIVREVWNGVPGANVSSIPLATPPGSTSVITSLQGAANAGDSYGVRVRGYLSAPATGVYQFWLAGDEAAELYISDDDEPVNAWKRASLTTPVAGPMSTPIVPGQWANAAKSPLLHLTVGNRYYIEVRHKEDVGSDHFAVGWSRPGESTAAPSEIVPGYLLSQFHTPAPVDGNSTLYTATLTPQNNAVTGGFGNATLQVNAQQTEAVLRFDYGNLTGIVTQKHIHSGPDAGLILFDLDTATPAADGSYVWSIAGVAGVTDKDGDGDSDAADVVRLIEDGGAYLNLHTAMYPAGEIKGFFNLAAGSQEFIAPAPAPAWTDDHTSANAASRFLGQATFGGSSADIAAVQAGASYEAWINDQFTKPVSTQRPWVEANRNVTNPQGATYPSNLAHNSWWRTSVIGGDQLRQRVAFALSEILVTSTEGPLEDNARAVSDYYDMLLEGHVDGTGAPLNIGGIGTLNAGAFGNFRDILIATSLHPAMGRYLDMLRNDKPDKSTGRIPNENYAREILQLFSIGLYRMHPDGSLVLNSKGLPIPTYDQEEIIGFAHAFTGWDYFYTGGYRTSLGAGSNWIEPMREVPVRHFTGQKRILNNVVLPGLPMVGGQPLDPHAAHTSAQYNDPAYQALSTQELLATHDQIFNHPNVGPFICRQMIQRLVTSAPSRGYVYRVASKFNNNGAGVRGDMKAVIKAILLDYEARSPVAAGQQGFGKQREPIVRVAQIARAFQPAIVVAGTYRQDGGAIIVTTPTPHRLASGQPLTLNFTSGSPASTSGSYTVSTIGSEHPVTSTTFAVRTKDCIRGDYTQAGATTLTVNTQAAHGLANGKQAYIRFRTGATPPANGLYPITVVDSDTFTIQVAANTSSGKCDVAVLKGSYSMPRPPAGAPDRNTTVTITTTTDHGLASGANVYLDFALESVGSSTYSPADGLYAITVTSPTMFTLTAEYPAGLDAASGPTLTNTFTGSPEVPTINRGSTVLPFDTVDTGYSTYTMDSTNTDLAQTPLRSPTVFNFYVPDYQHSGVIDAARAVALANGETLTPGFQITTPEFQITSETNVIRQANFLYNGLFGGTTSTSGLSSFRSGGGDLAVDLSPWMGLRPGGTGYWTDHNPSAPANDNLRNLIRELSTLLTAGQVSTASQDAIYNWVSNTTAGNGNITYTLAAPTESQRRERARAIVHLIITSPDYTIQK